MKEFVGNVLLITAMGCNAMAATTACHPLLWPAESAVINPSISIPYETRVDLIKWSEKNLHHSPHPVSVLSSSGRTNINDPTLVASRKSLEDADEAAVLAVTYQLTNNMDYLNKAREILTSWASINQPTGHPIDETRLEGMIWAYDLIACDLSKQDKDLILNWFKQLRIKKKNWQPSLITTSNNYRIHQIKMLLLLDKILHFDNGWTYYLEQAKHYSTINLNPQSGASIDYIERNALYYHNYVMQPWLEISLITGCCEQPVKKGFLFLSNKILSHKIGGEFEDSNAKIDRIRAKGGFVYAKRGGRFDVTKAAPTIVTYYTIVRDNPEPDLWSIQQHSKPSAWLAFLNARRVLWKP